MHLVIVGYGYSASALAKELRPTLRSLVVTTRHEEKCACLRASGFEAITFNGTIISPSFSAALQKATHLVVSTPPDEKGDPLFVSGFDALSLPTLRRVIYLSTVGVYGDRGGSSVDECAELRPASTRSHQRAMAEASWQAFAARHGADLGIFRLGGIYGPGRGPVERLKTGTARCIVKSEQLFNRIHVADIAGAVTLALHYPEPLGIFNLVDDEPAAPQHVLIHAAKLMGVDPPPMIDFESVTLTPTEQSFYKENKRVSNGRIKRELGYVFRYPTYLEGVASLL